MTRTAQDRYIADLRLVVEIGAASEAEAAERLEAALDFLKDRAAKTTFRRLAGQPDVTYSDISSDVIPA